MVGVLEITFTAFYPRKQHCSVAKLALSIIRLYDRGHVHITLAAVTFVGRRAADPFPHLGCGGGGESGRAEIQRKMGRIQKDERAAYLSFNASSRGEDRIITLKWHWLQRCLKHLTVPQYSHCAVSTSSQELEWLNTTFTSQPANGKWWYLCQAS